MKKYLSIILAAMLCAWSCEQDLSDIETRLDNLESGLDSASGRLDELEATISNINAELETLRYLKGGIVINAISGSNADGWTVTLSNGTVLKVYPKDASTYIPILSVSEDGYWMADMGTGSGPQYIHDASGNRIAASSEPGDAGADGADGITPMLGFDDEGYWTVSYDKGVTYSRLLDASGNPVKAQISVGDSIFSSVTKDGNSVVFTLNNGEVYTVPIVPDFLCSIKDADGEQEFEAGATRTFELEMKGVADAIVVCPEGWSAVLDGTSLSVTAPAGTKAVAYSTEGYVSVLATCTSGFAAIAKMAVKVKAATKVYTSYYEMWEDGEDITIDGVAYNKATYGGGTLLSTDFNISASGIYFLKDGVTATLTASVNKIIVIGDNVSGRGTAVLNAGNYHMFNSTGDNEYVILKGIGRVTTTKTDRLFFVWKNNTNAVYVIDDCYVDCSTVKQLLEINGAISIAKFSVIDSEIKLNSDGGSPTIAPALVNSDYNNARTISTMKLVNSVVYTPETKRFFICIGSNATTIKEFTCKGNSFINVGYDGSYVSMFSANNVPTFNAQNNYFDAGSLTTSTYISFTINQNESRTMAENHCYGYTGENAVRWTVTSLGGSAQYLIFPRGINDTSSMLADDFDATATSPNFKLKTTEYGAQR